MTTEPILSRLFSLRDKKALITGASGGIGRALAAGMAAAGAQVGVHGRSRDAIEGTCEEVRTGGGVAVALCADLSTGPSVAEACRQLVAEAESQLEGLDILINCAGTNRRKRINAVTEDDYDHVMAVNLKSVYFLSQAAYPALCKRGGGRIIHIGSLNAYYGLDSVSIYGGSKGGVAQLTKVMAVEWAPDNIQVNCLVPGFIDTPLTEPLQSDEQKMQWFRNRIPARRFGQSDELVGLAITLAAPASSYITGQSFVVDGGFLAGGSWLRDGA